MSSVLEKFTALAKQITPPPIVLLVTNITSEEDHHHYHQQYHYHCHHHQHDLHQQPRCDKKTIATMASDLMFGGGDRAEFFTPAKIGSNVMSRIPKPTQGPSF